jgi:hypothetical protein
MISTITRPLYRYSFSALVDNPTKTGGIQRMFWLKAEQSGGIASRRGRGARRVPAPRPRLQCIQETSVREATMHSSIVLDLHDRSFQVRGDLLPFGVVDHRNVHSASRAIEQGIPSSDRIAAGGSTFDHFEWIDCAWPQLLAISGGLLFDDNNSSSRVTGNQPATSKVPAPSVRPGDCCIMRLRPASGTDKVLRI